MKVKLLYIFFLVAYQFSFSQTEKPVKGKVLCDNFLLEKVNVINKTNKKGTVTNENGEFIIEAKVNDSLVFYAKEYHLLKLKLSSTQVDQNNLIIRMLKKPEELEEVIITTIDPIKWKIDSVWEREKRLEAKLDMEAKKAKTGVYDGTIENGMDFMLIGKMLGLFGKGKDGKKEIIPKVEFAVLAKNTFNQKFYVETLKIKPDQIDLFLQFCDSDSKSKTLIEHHNILSMMDFLMAKNKEFKKLGI